MRALTLRQPWAGAVCDLGKRLENRQRPPPRNLPFGEVIAIHAGMRDTRAIAEQRQELGRKAAADWGCTWATQASMLNGCVLAICRVIGWLEVGTDGELKRWRWEGGERLERPWSQNPERAAEQTRQVGRWWVGPCAWELASVRVLPKPVPARGALGLWRVPDDVATDVMRQMEAPF